MLHGKADCDSTYELADTSVKLEFDWLKISENRVAQRLFSLEKTPTAQLPVLSPFIRLRLRQGSTLSFHIYFSPQSYQIKINWVPKLSASFSSLVAQNSVILKKKRSAEY